MHIILGGTGHLGSAAARTLLQQGQPVTVVTRSMDRAAALKKAGAKIAVVDIRDVVSLRKVLRTGRRAFLLNPPADPSSDTDIEERATISAILDAMDGSGLEKIVAASAYGARSGERCGDLTVLHEFEERLQAQPIPAAINRGAYYMSNWAGMLDGARESGRLPSFLPADLVLPMVAPADLGKAAAQRLLEPVEDRELRHVEGPERYTPQDVAEAFSDLLGRPVEVEPVPRDEWEAGFRQLGFSKEAAASYSCMTATMVDGNIAMPDDPERGATSLRDYLRAALARSAT